MYVYNRELYEDDNVVGIQDVDTFSSVEEFEDEYSEYENNPDFQYMSGYSDIESINGEFLYQGFDLLEVKKMNLRMYGSKVICLRSPCEDGLIHVFVGMS